MYRRWFYPIVSGLEAEKLLLEKGSDGSFLVRFSSSNPGDFTLSVRRNKEVTHIKIQNNGDFIDLYGGEKFATLSELVECYMENNSQIKGINGQVIKLESPLMHTELISERWFHSHLSGIEAEKLLLEKGKNGTFLVRQSQSKPGDYVLSIRVDDKISHVMIRLVDNKFDVGGGPQFTTLNDLIEHYKNCPMVDKCGTVVHLKHPYNVTRIKAVDIDIRVNQLMRCLSNNQYRKDGFWEEFESLQQQECHQNFARFEGQKPENRSKNRYKNILPFDHSRVLLRDSDSDYINANYIRHLSDPNEMGEEMLVQSDILENNKTYIATQGCLPSTIEDFWNMIWNENSRIIVMTTKEIERGKKKCEKYWPDSEKRCQWGQASVTCVTETSFMEYILREFSFSWKGMPERRIYQYHFLIWPDHGTPNNPSGVLNFLQDVNEKQRFILNELGVTPPLCIHCSAGIGRTGTFIVIDMILDRIDKEGLNSEIDILRTVQMVRSQRSGMVQTGAQYKFVYLAVQNYVQTKICRLEASQRMTIAGIEYTNINNVK